MPRLPDIPYVYRFANSPKTYGPRPLEWVCRIYSEDTTCLARPDDGSADWRPVSELHELVEQGPAGEADLAELKKLKVPHDPTSISKVNARQLIGDARDALPLTPTMKRRLKEAGLGESGAKNRGEASRILTDLDTISRVDALRENGCELGPSPSLDEINRFESELESLDHNLKAVAARGFRFSPPDTFEFQELVALNVALDRFWSEAGDLPDILREMKDEERIARVPSQAALKAEFALMFQLIREGQWDDGGALIVAEAALARDPRVAPRETKPRTRPSPPKAGCAGMVVLAIISSSLVGVVVVVLAGGTR